jgi:hypothetical protein
MNQGCLVFSQVMDFLPLHQFRRCVERYRGHHKVQHFSCFDQFLSMAFAQLTFRESLRDIEACLRAVEPRLYHMGFRSRVARSTLARANENRDWRIYADLAQVLIRVARPMYANEYIGLDLDQTIYALDSTTISLCLSLFPWARFRSHEAGVKLHTQLDLRGPIPCVVCVTDAQTHDVQFLDQIVPEPGAFYVVDRGYLDFGRLFAFEQASAFFVTRARKAFRFRRLASRPVDKSTGLRSDQTIGLVSFYPRQSYPERLRRVTYVDLETRKRFVFLTNNFTLPALMIALLYKCRWQIELFFKWIKQHLRIKAFFGTSENAVKTQVWIAISVYVLVAIIKKRLQIDRSLYTILQILSFTLLEQVSLVEVLALTCPRIQETAFHNQLSLFDL